MMNDYATGISSMLRAYKVFIIPSICVDKKVDSNVSLTRWLKIFSE